MPLCAQDFLNGSFENHTAPGCGQYYDYQYNSYVEDSYAYGTIGSGQYYLLDSIDNTCESYPMDSVADGAWCFGLAGGGFPSYLYEAKASLKLSIPLSTDFWYQLSFYDKAMMPPPLAYGFIQESLFLVFLYGRIVLEILFTTTPHWLILFGQKER